MAMGAATLPRPRKLGSRRRVLSGFMRLGIPGTKESIDPGCRPSSSFRSECGIKSMPRRRSNDPDPPGPPQAERVYITDGLTDEYMDGWGM